MIPRLVTAGLGVWLLAAPDVLGYGGTAASVHQIAGALVASVAVVAIWEVLRSLRWINAILGAALVIATFVVAQPGAARVHGVAAGLVIAVLATVRGPTRGTYDGGWRMLVRP